jgi:hypothetical protein
MRFHVSEDTEEDVQSRVRGGHPTDFEVMVVWINKPTPSNEIVLITTGK